MRTLHLAPRLLLPLILFLSAFAGVSPSRGALRTAGQAISCAMPCCEGKAAHVPQCCAAPLQDSLRDACGCELSAPAGPIARTSDLRLLSSVATGEYVAKPTSFSIETACLARVSTVFTVDSPELSRLIQVPDLGRGPPEIPV